MKHERETLEAVIAARNVAYQAGQQAAAHPGQPQAMRELNGAEAQLGGAIGRLFALAEAYPDLKANQNMLSLQEELSSTENKIAFSRQAYNDSVTALQHPPRAIPGGHFRRNVRFRRSGVVRGDQRKGREAPQVKF